MIRLRRWKKYREETASTVVAFVRGFPREQRPNETWARRSWLKSWSHRPRWMCRPVAAARPGNDDPPLGNGWRLECVHSAPGEFHPPNLRHSAQKMKEGKSGRPFSKNSKILKTNALVCACKKSAKHIPTRNPSQGSRSRNAFRVQLSLWSLRKKSENKSQEIEQRILWRMNLNLKSRTHRRTQNPKTYYQIWTMQSINQSMDHSVERFPFR